MKTFSFLLLLLAFNINAREIEMKTNITDVTVFQTGAQVKRIGSAKIPIGESEITISDATPLLKKESIQVKGEGNFTILSVNYQVKLNNVENEKAKWAELEAKQKSLMQQMEELSVKLQVLNSQEAAIMNLQYISTSTKGITVDQVAKAQELVHIKLTEIKTEKLKNSRLVLALFDEHKSVTQHLLSLKTPKQNVHHEIVIKVASKAEVNGDFTLSYIVPNARWYPTYDLRVKNISEPMTIEYKANVSQESGEDWNNVKLKLSSGDPSQSSQKPKIEAWWLYLNQNYVQPHPQNNFYRYTDARYTHINGAVVNEETGNPIPWCNVMVLGTNIGTTADAEGKFSLALPENATQLSVYCVGYYTQTATISEKNITIKLQKQNAPLGETVKTDYTKSLMALQSPMFNTDYEGELSTLDFSEQNLVQDAYAVTSEDAGYANEAMSASYSTVSTTNVSKELLKLKGQRSEAYKVTATKTLNIVSTEFAIDEKYTIPSDPKNITVSIQTIQTDAKYQYYCAPRLDKDVFITAQLLNWEKYNLLEGQANVFFEGTFIGNTFFDTRYLVDTLEISLGRDKGIKVERKKAKDYNKRQIAGNENIAYRDWEITIRNAKLQAVDIIIEDQFPVSTDSKVVVSQEEKTDGQLNESTGIITWPFKLDPSATKNLQLKYKVKYPKENFIGLD
jgi:hypothetical protein